MITLKIPYTSSPEFITFLKQLRKEYSCVVRYSYNRLKEGKSEKDIRYLVSALNNINNLDAWTIQCGILEAKQILTRFKNKKVIFGGKSNFIKSLKQKITNLNDLRILPLNIQGETAYGNRKFKLDIINNNQIIYKHKIHNHFKLLLPKLNKNYQKLLNNLEFNKGKYAIKLTDTHILISLEEVKVDLKLNELRYLGIDLNPEYIGLSIKEGNNIIFTKCFSMKVITDKIINSGLASNNPKLKHLNNKLNHEILEISKNIHQLISEFKVKFIFLEDLNFKKDTWNNRLNKNLWKRNLFTDNLTKRCNITGNKIFYINPTYTSLIGNCQYNYVDPVNASLEIARRGFECIIKKTKQFYPVMEIKESLKHQWKEMVNDLPNNWKDLFSLTKNSKLRYRVSTEMEFFRKFKTNKSHISYLCD